MPSAPNKSQSQLPADVLFDELLAEVKALMGVDHTQQCRQALHEAMTLTSAAVQRLRADSKAHPDHEARNERQILNEAVALGKAVAAYARCLHGMTVRMA